MSVERDSRLVQLGAKELPEGSRYEVLYETLPDNVSGLRVGVLDDEGVRQGQSGPIRLDSEHKRFISDLVNACNVAAIHAQASINVRDRLREWADK